MSDDSIPGGCALLIAILAFILGCFAAHYFTSKAFWTEAYKLDYAETAVDKYGDPIYQWKGRPATPDPVAEVTSDEDIKEE